MDEESPCEDKFVSFRSIPTLENIALVSLVGSTCSVRELTEQLRGNYLEFYYHEADMEIEQYFSEMEKKIMNKLGAVLPPKLLDKAVVFIRPIGRQIFRWMFWIRRNFRGVFDSMDLDSVCWTMNGTMDRLKTFELLLAKKNAFNVGQLYSMACFDCNQARVMDIWRKMPKKIKSYYPYAVSKSFLVSYWTAFMKMPGRLTKKNIAAYLSHERRSKDALEDSIRDGNSAGVKFFWDKLPDKAKNENIVTWTESAIEKHEDRPYDIYQETSGHTDIMCFLLSQMKTEEQQREVFQKHGEKILKALLYHWPWQQYLVPTLSATSDFLDEDMYLNVIQKVVYEIKEGRTTQLLLREVWYKSPLRLRKSFVIRICTIDVLWRLFRIGDVDMIRLMLNDISVEERKNLTFAALSKHHKELLYALLYSYEFEFFELLFHETFSDEDIVSFKEHLIEKYGVQLCYPWIGEVDWQPLEVILDWCFSSREEVEEFEDDIFERHMKLKESLHRRSNFNGITKILYWSICTAGDLGMFRTEFAWGGYVTELDNGGWNIFKKCINWCYDPTGHELTRCSLNQYKKALFNQRITFVVFRHAFQKYNFEFAQNFLHWYFQSDKRIAQFKRRFLCSDEGRDTFEFYITDQLDFCDEWELKKKLVRWFYPVDKQAIASFKLSMKNNSAVYKSHRNECEKLFDLLEKFSSVDTDPHDTDDFVNDYDDSHYTDDSESEDTVSHDTDVSQEDGASN